MQRHILWGINKELEMCTKLQGSDLTDIVKTPKKGGAGGNVKAWLQRP